MVEKAVTLDDINATLIYSLTRDNIVGDSRTLHYSFNNLKWFENIWSFDELYRASNTNGLIIYNIEDIVIVPFLSLGETVIQGRLQAVYILLAPVNFISIEQF